MEAESLSIASQIFLVFYAVLYGALFTFSDRWRPFFMTHSSQQGWNRLLLSLFFFGVAPVVYLILVLPLLMLVAKSSIISIGLAIYAIAPLVAFYLLWVWLVISWKDKFYSEQELQLDPVKNSFLWVGEKPLSKRGVVFLLYIFLFVPISLLMVYPIAYLYIRTSKILLCIVVGFLFLFTGGLKEYRMTTYAALGALAGLIISWSAVGIIWLVYCIFLGGLIGILIEILISAKGI